MHNLLLSQIGQRLYHLGGNVPGLLFDQSGLPLKDGLKRASGAELDEQVELGVGGIGLEELVVANDARVVELLQDTHFGEHLFQAPITHKALADHILERKQGQVVRLGAQNLHLAFLCVELNAIYCSVGTSTNDSAVLEVGPLNDHVSSGTLFQISFRFLPNYLPIPRHRLANHSVGRIRVGAGKDEIGTVVRHGCLIISSS